MRAIESKAYADARAPLDTERAIFLFLRSWWSRTYNKPFKDPMLATYSLEELLYEFYDRSERLKAVEESIEQETDKIEEQKEQAALDWAEREEQKELAELQAKEEEAGAAQAEQEANQAWMDEQLAKQKEMFGDDFGEDLDLNSD